MASKKTLFNFFGGGGGGGGGREDASLQIWPKLRYKRRSGSIKVPDEAM